MFGIGLGELLILLVIGIIILGPERCVKSAKMLGRAWGKLQREWRDIKKDVSVDDEIRKLKKDITDASVDDEIRKLKKDIEDEDDEKRTR